MILVEFIKRMKILLMYVILLYIFEICLLEINLKSKFMTIFMEGTTTFHKTKMVKKQNSLIKDIEMITKVKETKHLTDSSLNRALLNPKDKTLSKPECFINSLRKGRVNINLSVENMQTIENSLASTVVMGGRYTPATCASKQRIAIVIPYRDREEHLKIFLRHMHPFLQSQQLEYGIYVIEMERNLTFNRAMLMNIGFVEAMKLYNYSCFVFHDVDLLPEDGRIPYSCSNMPTHLSVAVDKFHYRLPYGNIFGGVCAIKTNHFRKINGMSNMFFGWGGEDDDLRQRIRLNNLTIGRPPIAIARYTMINHTEEKMKNPERVCLLRSIRVRMRRDGLSNLKYSVLLREFHKLYTCVSVRVNETEQVESDKFLFRILKLCKGIRKNKMKYKDAFL